MKRVAIVQARMTSSRLPGKVLRELVGSPLLAHQLRRLRQCGRVDEIVVATTANPADDAVVALGEREGARWFRGSETDVLSRYVGAAREARAELVIRVTGDCPLLDPVVTDLVVEAAERHAGACDYASNIIERTYPRGLDTEALFRDTLERVHRFARSPAAREHVTGFLREECPEYFRIVSVTDHENHADLRWTVDTTEDFAMVRRLYEDLGLAERLLGFREVAAYVRAHPEIAVMNAHVEQRPYVLR